MILVFADIALDRKDFITQRAIKDLAVLMLLLAPVPTGDFYRAALYANPYPVRALIGFGANMLLNHANGAHGREALKALKFFAHADLFMTPTAELPILCSLSPHPLSGRD